MDVENHEAILREIRTKKAVLTLPGMDGVRVQRGTYHTGYEDLGMDIYYPSDATGPVPVVVIAFGFPDPPGQIREYGPMTSWARLFAASGVASVIYATNECKENVHAVLRHLRANAAELRVDASRIGIWAISGSVSVALSALMRDDALKCAALICGCTIDLDGSTAIADMAKQYLFTDACAGKSVDDLPDGVPMLFLRAGQEHFPGVNEALDRVVSKAVARNLPVTVVNHATGGHSFAFDEDNDLSREMIRRVLAFLAFHLGA
jgi:hypothetical protein